MKPQSWRVMKTHNSEYVEAEALASALYRDGWSNHRIAEKLGISVSEARWPTR